MKCPFCNRKLSKNTKICPNCGQRVEVKSRVSKIKGNKFTKKQLFESFGMAMSDENTTIKKVNETNITPDTNRNRRTRPFEAPRKFKK